MMGSFTSVIDMLRGFREAREAAAAEQREALTQFRVELNRETAVFLNDITQQRQATQTEQRAKLAAFEIELRVETAAKMDELADKRAEMQHDLSAHLEAVQTGLRNDVSDMMQQFSTGRQRLAFEQGLKLEQSAAQRRDSVDQLREMMREEMRFMADAQQAALHANSSERRQAVRKMLDGFAVGRESAFADQRAELEAFQANLQAEVQLLFSGLGATVAVAEPAKSAAKAMPKKALVKPAIALTAVHGIGPKTERMLQQIGIADCAALAAAQVAVLGKKLDGTIPPARLETWIVEAAQLIS